MKLPNSASAGDSVPGSSSPPYRSVAPSTSPALAEFGNFVTVALRNALLADPHPAAVQKYLELAPYDLDILGSASGR